MKLPTELKELICLFLKFEFVIHLSNYISKKKYDEKRFDWDITATNGQFEIIKWLYIHRSTDC